MTALIRDLSVIIPARNEEFLNLTVQEVLGKSRGNTECIAVLDGDWPKTPLEQHEQLTVIYNPTPIGQRASINEAARLSRARYIMKLDAHCVLDEGFDVKLIESAKELGREVTQVPKMYNLHAYDWVCDNNHRKYQAPKPRIEGICDDCGAPSHKEIVWKPRWSRLTSLWQFDKDLHFQYWQEGQREQKGDYVETMSLIGACFFMDREWFWELGGCDEGHGSWGQQGTEVACKTWLSGGRLICNKKTWFSHFFRVGGIGFPYPNPDSVQNKAREYSKDYWRNLKFPKAIHDLQWLVDKFKPPTWRQ